MQSKTQRGQWYSHPFLTNPTIRAKGSLYCWAERWLHRSFLAHLFCVGFMTSASAGTNAVLTLDTLVNADGQAYIAARDALLAQTTIAATEHKQPEVALLQDILIARKGNHRRFSEIDKSIDKFYATFKMQPVAKQNDITSGRYLELGGKLAKRIQRNEVSLYLAMAELLWKTSRNAYEKRSALHVLSLSEKPLTGLHEVLRDELRKCEHPVLAQDILSLITQYILTYGIGDKHQLFDDSMFAVRKFPDANSLHALASRVAREIDSPDSTALRDEIKRIEEENRPAVFDTTDTDSPLELDIE